MHIRAAIPIATFLGATFLAGAAYAEPPTADTAKAEAREIYKRVVELDTSVEGKKVPEMANWLADKFKAAGFAAADVNVIPMGDTAALVVSHLGDPADPARVLQNRSPARPSAVIGLDDLAACLPARQAAVVVNSSIGLWCCAGVPYSASNLTSAAAKAASASPACGRSLARSLALLASSSVTPGDLNVALGCSAL